MSTEIQNRLSTRSGSTVLNNPYGSGMSIEDVDQLVPGGAASALANVGVPVHDGLDLVRGDGTSAWFDLGTNVGPTQTKDVSDFQPDDENVWKKTLPAGVPFNQYVEGDMFGPTRYTKNSTATGSWQLTNLTPHKMYEVFANWSAADDRATVDYSVTGGKAVGMTPGDGKITINQKYAAAPTEEGWRSLGFFVTDGTTLTITLKRHTTPGAAQGDPPVPSDGVMMAGSVGVRVVSEFTPNQYMLATFQTPQGSFSSLRSASDGEAGTPDDPVQFIVTSKYGTQYQFDAAGMMTNIRDRNGNVTTYTYNDPTDTQPRTLKTVQDQFGVHWDYTYSSQTSGTLTKGSLSLVSTYAGTKGTDNPPRETKYAISDSKVSVYLPNAITASGASTSGSQSAPNVDFNYSSDGFVTSFSAYTTDTAKNTTTIEYNPATHQIKQVTNAESDEAGNRSIWSLNSVQTVALTISNNKRPVFAVGNDPTSNRPQAVYTNERNKVRKYTTDRFGYITLEIDPLQKQWIYERNPIANPISSFIPASDDGLLTRMLQPAGGQGINDTGTALQDLGQLITTYTYEYNPFSYQLTGNLAQETFPDGKKQSWTYGSYSQVASFIDELGHKTEYWQDLRGNVTDVKRYTGDDQSTYVLYDTTTYTYTPVPASANDMPGGLLDETIAPKPNNQSGTVTTKNEYYSGNLRGLLQKTTYAYGEPPVDGQDVSSYVEYVYDSNRNLAKYFDELRRETDTTYDNLDELVSKTLPAPAVDDEKQPHYAYAYDRAGNQTIAVAPNRTTGDASIDSSGNVTAGVATVTTYDKMDRVQTVTDAAPGGPDNVRNLTLQTKGVTKYTYDAAGNLKLVEFMSDGNALYRFTSYEYDDRNLLIKVTGPDPGVNDGGTDHPAPVTQYSYDVLGQLASTTTPRGAITTFAYDERGRQVAEVDPDAQSKNSINDTNKQIIGAKTITSYYDNGLVKSITAPGPSASSGSVTSFKYDELGRKIEETDPADDNGVSAVTKYAYDSVDNLTSMTLFGVINYIVLNNTPDLLGQTTTYRYDLRDRQIYVALPESGGLLNSNSPETKYVYDAAGQLTSMQQEVEPNRWRTTSYEYDKDGRLVKQTDPAPASFGLGPVTTYRYDTHDNQIKETSANNEITLHLFDDLDREVETILPAPSPTQPQPDTVKVYNTASNVIELWELAPGSENVANNPAPSTIFSAAPDPFGPQTHARVTRYAYDQLDRMIKETDPAILDDAVRNPMTEIHYDADSNPTTISSPQYVTTDTYDYLDRLMDTYVGTNNPSHTHYDYDNASNRNKVTDPMNRIHQD